MRVLVLWPPHVPSYFNAGHHLALFLVSSYLRSNCGAEVRVMDAGALNSTWKDLGDVLDEQFDVVALANEYDAVDGFGRTVRYARQLSPGSRLITFGRLSRDLPAFFERYDVDAIAESGDYEACLESYVGALADGREREPLPGVRVCHDGRWLPAAGPGRFLDPEQWCLPDIEEIPYEAYDRLYVRDQNKFCGIPERRELVIPVARGCPVNCSFCDVPRQQGLRERRLPVARVVEYLTKAFTKSPFEYASMYAPTFTLKRGWVLELCAQLERLERRYPWKCATTLHHLDEELIGAMARAGCVRISVGLETLDALGGDALPRLKHTEEQRFGAVAAWCTDSGIELNCFVILGLPGTTPEGAAHTVARVREVGARVRPTIYTPYEQMRSDMTEEEVGHFNRQLFVTDAVEDAPEWYALLFGHEPSPTRVMTRIPVRPA